MIIELVVADGPRLVPLRLVATQVLIRQDNGTPLVVAAEYGAERSQAVAVAGQPDFNRMLRALGVAETTLCDRLELPGPPPGARLVTSGK